DAVVPKKQLQELIEKLAQDYAAKLKRETLAAKATTEMMKALEVRNLVDMQLLAARSLRLEARIRELEGRKQGADGGQKAPDPAAEALEKLKQAHADFLKKYEERIKQFEDALAGEKKATEQAKLVTQTLTAELLRVQAEGAAMKAVIKTRE